jgi:LemA protein
MNKWLLLVIAVAVAVVMMGVSSYNGLIGMNENVTAKWSQVETNLERRADLIPNLVITVTGYNLHEQNAILAVSDASRRLAGAYGPQAKAQANADMNSALSRLMVVIGRYPNLKADKQFSALIDELSGIESSVVAARKDYNEVVNFYNLKIRTLPTSIFAGLLGFGPKEYFKPDEAAEEVPRAQF